MSLITFSDRLQVLRTRGYLPDLHNFLILHTEELEGLIRAAERWQDAVRFMHSDEVVKAAEKGMITALAQLTEKRAQELL